MRSQQTMQNKKQTVRIAIIWIAGVYVLGAFLGWAFPNYVRTSPAGVALQLALLALLAVPYIYILGVLVGLAIDKVSGVAATRAPHNPPKSSIIYLLVWLVLAGGLGFGLGSYNMPKFWVLAKRGVVVKGRVSVKEKRPIIHYTYTVGKQTYQGTDGIGNDAILESRSLNVGDDIAVVYDPFNPQVSALGDIEGRLRNEINSLGLVILIVPTLLTLSLKGSLEKANQNK